MNMPYLDAPARSRDMTYTWRGYNNTLLCGEGEFSGMQNMTSQYYPVLSPRRQRGISATALMSPQGIICKDGLWWVDGPKLYNNGSEITGITLSTLESKQPKTLISMGAYLIILPDKIYYNTADPADKGYIDTDNRVTLTSSVRLTLTVCKADGSDYSNIISSATAPSDPANGELWLDTSGDTHCLKQWSASASLWITVITTYIRVSCPGIGLGLKKYDGVALSINPSVGEDLPEEVKRLNASCVVYGATDNSVIVVGLLDTSYAFTSGSVRVSRTMPVLDYITEADNRLWGCRYGLDADGNTVNEIYACAQGDCRNWSRYMGISTDSYRVSVGTDGVFTGAATYGGFPIFFKENCIHKVYGDFPAEYRVPTTTCPGLGIQKYSAGSCVVVNGTLFYKSPYGVCAYDGSLPQLISEALGDVRYSEAVAGGIGKKYYISTKNPSGEWNMFVFDAERGLWHREDATHALFFAAVDTELYYIDADNNKIYGVNGTGAVKENPVEWYAETGNIGLDHPDRKYVSRFNLRMSLDSGSSVQVFVMYDSSGTWEHKGSLTGKGLRSFTLPIIPRRCDHMRIRISGRGDCRIISLAKITETGSDCR